jgi:flagellar hook protein FlgE
MDVIGNNIANVNTTGFKKGRVNFMDLLYQAISGASRPNDEVGGVNPKEIGLGMVIASIDTIHTQGALQTTGKTSDLAITGNGFFVLKKGEQTLYTRAGAFDLDEAGTLVNPANGFRVQGWAATQVNGEWVVNASGPLEDLVIPIGSKDPAKATTSVDLACNLDKRANVVPEGVDPAAVENGQWRVEEKVYDAFGNPHILRIDFVKVPDQPNRWRATVTVDPQAEVATGTVVGLNAEGLAGTTFDVEFDNTGKLLRVYDEAGNPSAEVGRIGVSVGFNVPDAALVEGAPAQQVFTLNLGTIGSTDRTVTQYADRFSTKVFSQDGYTMGYLESYRIDQNGEITAVFSNGSNRVLGQIALATFANPNGLEKTGDTNFRESINSGMANIGPSGIAGKGRIISGTLEMSNVDLAESFTDMIVTQRGFQANSKTIQTSDQMLQELLTLKR